VTLIGLNPDMTCEGANRYDSCDGVQFCTVQDKDSASDTNTIAHVFMKDLVS